MVSCCVKEINKYSPFILKLSRHIFSSIFMTKLMVSRYPKVSQWSRHVPGQNIFNLKYLFLPTNIGGEHWALVVENMKKEIIYHDSLLGRGQLYLITTLDYPIKEYCSVFGTDLPNADKWALKSDTSIPV